MKPDRLEIPQMSNQSLRVDIDLRYALEIYQRGGRVTRSTLCSSNRLIEPKVKERYKTLIHYMGDPSLSKYLENTNIRYK